MEHQAQDPDLVARELNALAAQPARKRTQATDAARLEAWLAALGPNRASDLLLVAGAPPCIRVDSQIRALSEDEGPLDGLDIEEAVLPALPPHARCRYDEAHITDASLKLPGLGRFRVNLRHERGRAAATIRALPTTVPRLDSLNLPAGVELPSQAKSSL